MEREYKGIEIATRRGAKRAPQTARRAATKMVVAIACLASMGSGFVAAWTYRTPTSNVDLARGLASSAATESDRTNAVVVMLRDVRKSVSLLKTMAETDTESATQARAALTVIEQSLR